MLLSNLCGPSGSTVPAVENLSRIGNRWEYELAVKDLVQNIVLDGKSLFLVLDSVRFSFSLATGNKATVLGTYFVHGYKIDEILNRVLLVFSVVDGDPSQVSPVNRCRI